MFSRKLHQFSFLAHLDEKMKPEELNIAVTVLLKVALVNFLALVSFWKHQSLECGSFFCLVLVLGRDLASKAEGQPGRPDQTQSRADLQLNLQIGFIKLVWLLVEELDYKTRSDLVTICLLEYTDITTWSLCETFLTRKKSNS